jgi:hypothetical protein
MVTSCFYFSWPCVEADEAHNNPAAARGSRRKQFIRGRNLSSTTPSRIQDTTPGGRHTVQRDDDV